MFFRIFILVLSSSIFFSSCNKTDDDVAPDTSKKAWRFAVIGDTHVDSNSHLLDEMIPYLIADSVDLVLFCGDIVEGGLNTTADDLESQMNLWMSFVEPLYTHGIGVYPVRGNHEDDANGSIITWNKIFSGAKTLPNNGPVGEVNLTYSVAHKNAIFIGMDHYKNIHRVNASWLDDQLNQNTNPHVFVFGHEAAFKVFHSDCLDDYPTERNAFWELLSEAGSKAYFCGHDHFFDAASIDDGDASTENDVRQVLVGGGGGWLMPQYAYNGDNSPYTMGAVYHREEHGYALVEVSGETDEDLDFTITWKERTNSGSTVQYLPTQNILHLKAFQSN